MTFETDKFGAILFYAPELGEKCEQRATIAFNVDMAAKLFDA